MLYYRIYYRLYKVCCTIGDVGIGRAVSVVYVRVDGVLNNRARAISLGKVYHIAYYIYTTHRHVRVNTGLCAFNALLLASLVHNHAKENREQQRTSQQNDADMCTRVLAENCALHTVTYIAFRERLVK
jgi:hypothetical protein